ncbi:MAG: GDP-mannose 4,6-dehydratase, partial [Candidatus Omnitrophica bacterium]|nr:GDP-mannose 4,6-dehydratase [Candidatus Omnitrophota bacterium]
MKRAVIVGANGQDGRLLYDLLLKQRYSIVRIDKDRVHYPSNTLFKRVDICRYDEVARFVRKFQPHEVYYLAAFHHSSENLPDKNLELLRRSYDVHVGGLANFLEAIKDFSRKTRLFYAASSHIFDQAKGKLQDENTPQNPVCIYGITKAAGLALCRFYRRRYNIFAATGILYNHESTLRNENFVSMRIIKGAINVKNGKQKELVLGDLSAVIDWGYAPDYVRAMHLIINSKMAEDFIIAT